MNQTNYTPDRMSASAFATNIAWANFNAQLGVLASNSPEEGKNEFVNGLANPYVHFQPKQVKEPLTIEDLIPRTQKPLNDPVPSVITDFIAPSKNPRFQDLFPILVWGIICAVGIVNFILDNQPSADRLAAIRSWVFMCMQLALMPMLLFHIKKHIQKATEEAHLINQITLEEHHRIKNWIFGKPNTIGVCIIALVFGMWDYNGWWLASDALPQSWVYDIGGWAYLGAIPTEQAYYYVNGLGAVL
jgi:hypothetical protein